MEHKQIIVGDRQCLSDIAMQEYGCKDGVFLLQRDNPLLLTSLTDMPVVGMKLKVRVPVPKLSETNRAVVQYYADKKHSVVGGYNAPEVIPPIFRPYVITGYWAPTYTSHPIKVKVTSIEAHLAIKIE